MTQHIHTCPERGIVWCRICDDQIPLPKGCLSWVLGVLESFADVHNGCCHPTHTQELPGCKHSDCTGFVAPKSELK